MKLKMIAFFVLNIIIIIAMVVLVSISIERCTTEVETVGLKNIVNDIWEGKSE